MKNTFVYEWDLFNGYYFESGRYMKGFIKCITSFLQLVQIIYIHH